MDGAPTVKELRDFFGRGEAGQNGFCPAFVLCARGVSDVGDVMPAVPGVELQEFVEGHRAVFRVKDLARKGLGGCEFQQDSKAVVQVLNDGERRLNGKRPIRQQCPGFFVIGFDCRLILCQPEAEADKGIHVRVRNVMHQLPDAPSAVAIGSVEGIAFEREQGRFKMFGEVAHVGDRGLAGRVIGEGRERKLPNGVARV